jgi:hypothetical protein
VDGLAEREESSRPGVLENTFLRDMSFSAERRESDDVSRKLALYVLSPI